MAGSAQPLGAESGARRYQLFINGKFVDSRSGKRFESISPHDRAVVAVVAEGDKADIDAAVAAARAAYEGTWTTTPAGERARVLNKIADLLEANAAELGRLETLDMGMPILMTGGMGPLAAEVFRYWAGMATKLHGLTAPRSVPATSSATRCASRSVWWAASRRGTPPSSWPPGKRHPPSRAATRWS